MGQYDIDLLDNAIVLSKLSCGISVVVIQGKTKNHKIVVCNGIPIPFSAFCAIVIRFGAGVASTSNTHISSNIDALWFDINYTPKVSSDTRTITAYICSIVSEDNDIRVDRRMDLYPLLAEVHSQLQLCE